MERPWRGGINFKLYERKLRHGGEQRFVIAKFETRGTNLPLIDSLSRLGTEELGIDIAARREEYEFFSGIFSCRPVSNCSLESVKIVSMPRWTPAGGTIRRCADQ
jgi:hypothetical protein